MSNIENNFVPYQIALDMKSIGFDEPCFGYYEYSKKFLITDSVFYTNSELKNNGITTPLYQQCFRWFREKHNIQCYWYNNNGKHLKYWIVIQVNSTKPIEFSTKSSTPELECLKKLIKLIKYEITTHSNYQTTRKDN